METNSNQKVTCLANYAYEASEPDELTIKPGDVLREVDRLQGGWWRGELRGRRGMFPDNFVSVVTDHAAPRSGGVQGRCRAVFSYQPANPDELPLGVGDVLEVLGEVEEGWWQGRRQGRVGVFPSNFVVMLDPPQPVVPAEPAPALPPKPVKEQCRVLFPYSAVNDDELTLAEGDLVTIVSKEAPDRGWWRGELHGKVGLFPDNFVQLVPTVTQDVDEKKPDRPTAKPITASYPKAKATTGALPSAKPTTAVYPILNKYSEKTASVQELTTSKTSLHKENTLSKESTTQSTVTVTNKSESEKLIHNESVIDGSPDGQVKKPPVPLKKSPTPTTGVGGLFSGLKSKMMSTDKDKDKDKGNISSGSSSGEWDRLDGGTASKPASTFDHVERHSMLNDPRAGRVKAPRRRPPSQALRDDTPQQIGLSNGHDAEKPAPPEKADEIKPRTREWEKHKAPWMEELKLNQAKKTSFTDGKSRSVSSSEPPPMGKQTTGSTDRILDCGLEEKRTERHSMEMSKSTSSISSRTLVLENFEESKTRHSLDSRKDVAPPLPASEPPKPVQSPTAAGRTFTTMLDDIKKPPAPSPPAASIRTHNEIIQPTTHSIKTEKTVTEKQTEVTKLSGGVFDRTSTAERIEKEEKFPERPASALSEKTSTLERRLMGNKVEKNDHTDALIAQLNSRITNLEELLEVQMTKFNAAIEDLKFKLATETEKRQALQGELDKLAACVTQV